MTPQISQLVSVVKLRWEAPSLMAVDVELETLANKPTSQQANKPTSQRSKAALGNAKCGGIKCRSANAVRRTSR